MHSPGICLVQVANGKSGKRHDGRGAGLGSRSGTSKSSAAWASSTLRRAQTAQALARASAGMRMPGLPPPLAFCVGGGGPHS